MSVTPDQPPIRDAYFATTRWTLVVSAGHQSSPDSDKALAELCQTYWYPLYAYARRQSASKEDAEDVTQSFFARFLQRNYLRGLTEDQGRFRAFLLASLKHFLANEWDKSKRKKRGGGLTPLSLDWKSADDRFHLDPPDHSSPDHLFDREWALALLERVIARLREECELEGRGPLWEQCKGQLMAGEVAVPYEAAAQTLGMTPGALRVAVHRLRRRYRELLRSEIAQTLRDPARIDDELRSLRLALAR